MQDLRRPDPARRREPDRENQAEADRGPERLARGSQIAPAHALADDDVGGHAEAEDRREQQEHDDIGIGGRRQRRFAQEMTDPDRVDRAVQRLQDIGRERRQGEKQQGLGDRASGQVEAAAAGRARAFRRTGSIQQRFIADVDPCVFALCHPSSQPCQRCGQPGRFGGLLGMVAARFLDRLRLRLFDESGIAEAPFERLGFLGRGFE